MDSFGAYRALSRNIALCRVIASYALFILSEYGIWIVMIVLAYARGGGTTAGAVMVCQLVPAVLFGPALAPLADRFPPTRVLGVALAAQSLTSWLAAVLLVTGAPVLSVYAAAVLGNVPLSVTRPAQAAATPALARDARELAACNAALGWAQSVAIMLAGTLTGLLLTLGGPALAIAAAGTATALGALLVLPMATRSPRHEITDDTDAVVRRGGLAVLRGRPTVRLIVALTAAEYVVIGGLDLLFATLALDVLHRGQEWTGYLNTVHAGGGVLAVMVAGVLLGRRLVRPTLAAIALLSAAVALAAASTTLVVTCALLLAAGTGRAVLDVTLMSLLQRTAPVDLLARVFGLVEAVQSGGLLAGSIFAPLLLAAGGPPVALIGLGLVVPLVALVGVRRFARLDSEAAVPVTVVALLRTVPHFRALPVPQLEGLARSVGTRTYAAGETIIRQGEVGSSFYVVAEGLASVYVDGRLVRTVQRSDGVGEVALLRSVPRSATVVADGPVRAYEVTGEAFLAVTSGHEPTRRRAERVAGERLGEMT